MKIFLNKDTTTGLLKTINTIASCKQDVMEEISTAEIDLMWKHGPIGPAEELANWTYIVKDDGIYLTKYTNSEPDLDVYIYGYYMLNGVMYKTYVSGSGLFHRVYQTSRIKSITFLDYVKFIPLKETDTGAQMFHFCTSVESIDISKFDTSEISSAYSMFSECKKLTHINFGNMNTSKVTSTLNMFYNCQSLTSLDLTFFDTSSITTLQQMFFYAVNLKEVLVSRSKFIIPEDCSMYLTFDHCPVTDFTYVD